MSQSPALLNTSHPMKKKILAALVVVVMGHVGVLWAVNHMKTMELKPVEKDPIRIKFVKIQEPPKPEPPKPKEKPKPPEPKKEVKQVKVVEKALPPPKKIEKIQQVKKAEAPKPVVEKVEPKVESVVVSTTVTEKVIEKPQPVVEVPKAAAPPADRSIAKTCFNWWFRRAVEPFTKTVSVRKRSGKPAAFGNGTHRSRWER